MALNEETDRALAGMIEICNKIRKQGFATKVDVGWVLHWLGTLCEDVELISWLAWVAPILKMRARTLWEEAKKEKKSGG